MTVHETPEEWARRTGQGQLSSQRLDFLSSQVPDFLGYRITVPAEAMTEAIERYLAKVDEDAEVEFVGNWWIDGNPYKGINIALRDRDRYLKYEVQFHTEDSAQLADSNHPDYEIARDPERPLELRQAAYDRMVASFARIPHPPGIERIGTPLVKKRPVYESPEEDPRERVLRELMPVMQEFAERIGARVEIDRPEYRPDLKALLERGRDELQHRQFRTAIENFDELVERFRDDPERWSKRGVANALMNSGNAFLALERVEEAVARYDRVISMGERDPELRTDMMTAEGLKRKALSP